MILAEQLFRQYLDEGEKIVTVLHRHPFVLLKGLWPIVLVGFGLPAFLWYLFAEFWLFFLLWMVISAVRVFREFMIWYHDAILVTDVSLIDVYWHGFFDRSSTRLEYNMMEGVSTEIRGLRRVVFNYGTVSVQRGGGTNPLVLKDALNPRRAERRIMEYQEEYLNKQSIEDSASLKDLLTQMIRHHHKDQQKNQSEDINQS